MVGQNAYVSTMSVMLATLLKARSHIYIV